MTSDGLDCALAVTFEGDDFIEVDRFCDLENGAVGAQATIGNFEVAADGTSLRWFATDSTCSNAAPFSEKAAFEFLGDDRLRLVLEGSSRTWTRTDPEEAPSEYTFGCFDKSGRFTPGRLTPL